MKFLPLREFDDLTSSLNFDTPDCHVIGGCDLYTTKAASNDKKLYKTIEHSLESQYESLLRFTASLPMHASSAASALDLSRSSPFGPLTQISSRRTFAYLIATLNASHPDYDFSHTLRPADFTCERNLRAVMNTIDTTLYSLRPRPTTALSMPVSSGLAPPASPTGPAAIGNSTWGPQMWRVINHEMSLAECSIYSYHPDEDPYDGEDGAIWSFNYFFFNKNRKRVCYLYFRGLSIMSHSPLPPIDTPVKGRRTGGPSRSRANGASKRAQYWLGDRADIEDIKGGWDEDDYDDDEELLSDPEDDEVDVDGDIVDDGDEPDHILINDMLDERSISRQPRSPVRGLSEEIADRMEL